MTVVIYNILVKICVALQNFFILDWSVGVILHQKGIFVFEVLLS